MTNLRSEDWSVRPPFVANGPTSPVTLLGDDAGLTQLAGIPPVAWQTPWSEVGNLELVRFSNHLALFATIAGVRYCWRHKELRDLEALGELVRQHGGVVTRRRRRLGVLAVVAVVVAASFAGALAAWLNRANAGARELADVRGVNLSVRDLPSGWYVTSTSILNYLVPASSVVFTATSTTAPARNSAFSAAAALFQRCLGVTNRRDRIYGAAGQQPNYQVSSPIFTSSTLGGVELASTAQYYQSTQMVRRDTREMTKKNFGACFTASSAVLILSGFGLTNPRTNTATNWQPTTFLKGWSRAGVVSLNVPGVATKLQLVAIVVTAGHYEVTLNALVGSFKRTESFLVNEANTLLSRMTSSSATPV